MNKFNLLDEVITDLKKGFMWEYSIFRVEEIKFVYNLGVVYKCRNLDDKAEIVTFLEDEIKIYV